MTDFQSTVNIFNTLGFPGELAYANAPNRVENWILDSDGQAQVIGYAYTVTSGGSPEPVQNSPIAGKAKVGGTGIFAGILISPKEYSSYGTSADGPLAASLTLADNKVGSLMSMGYAFVLLTTTANVGDKILYDTTSGQLSSQAPSSTFTGVVATNTLTVSAFVAGGAPIAIGTVISGTGVTPGTVVSALGSGSGGNGTYTVTGAATVASTTMTGSGVAPSGKAFVPNAVVDTYTIAAAGVALIKLTN